MKNEESLTQISQGHVLRIYFTHPLVSNFQLINPPFKVNALTVVPLMDSPKLAANMRTEHH